MFRVHPADERGATIPLIALLISVLCVGTAITVDIGRVAATNRRLQAVADLVSLDATRKLTGARCDTEPYTEPGEPGPPSSLYEHVRAEVVASALRNGFPVSEARALSFEIGLTSADVRPVFTALPGCNSEPYSSDVPTSVRVVATDTTPYGFGRVAGITENRTSRSAAAHLGRVILRGPPEPPAPATTVPQITTTTMPGAPEQTCVGSCGSTLNPPPGGPPGGQVTSGLGGFVLSSSLASVDATQSILLNGALRSALCASSPVCRARLDLVSHNGLAASTVTLDALRAELGFGTVNELLAADLTAAQVLTAAARALRGDQIAAGQLESFAATITGTSSFELGQMLKVGQGAGSAANATVNVLTLLAASAALADGDHFLTVPVSGVSVPGVSAATVELTLIDPPVSYFGAADGSSVQTAQVRLRVVPTLATQVGVFDVSGPLPMHVVGGEASGRLDSVHCTGSPKRLGVTVTTRGATVKIDGVVRVTAGGLPVADIRLVGAPPAIAGTTQSALLDALGGEMHVGVRDLNLQEIRWTTAEVTPIGLSPVPLPVNEILERLNDAFVALDTVVVEPLATALGLSIAGADLDTTGINCTTVTL